MPDFWCDQGRLYEAVRHLEIEDLWVYELEWALKLRLWDGVSGPFSLAPNEVMETPRLYPERWRTTLGVDLRHPIVLAEKGNRWVLLDGYHRLLKATVQRTPSISVVRLRRSEVSSILVEEGFQGELNRLRRLAPDLLVPARAVARNLIERSGSEWAEFAVQR
jgi:hypothetical protein